ncbi:MAG TPA: peptide ABC transporter substrate-binding protein [Steroidobacteraceae bacterium]|nr:peptide ABC transporter substrate-binding protein [Steroidobacteraceae bacterium]
MSVPALPAGLAAVLAFGWLTGCSGAHTSGSAVAPAGIQVGGGPAATQVLARTLDDEPRSLDPALSNDEPDERVLDDLFEGLTTVAVDGRTIPGVAASWQQSADGLSWTFHLRPEARWSNGAPVTAQDFVYAWRRVVDPHTGSQAAQNLAPIRNALQIASGEALPQTLGAEALDLHTLRVRLVGPTPFLLELVSQPYLYPEYAPVVQQYADNWTSPGHMVSNGPFLLAGRVIGNRIVLERNPRYWDAAHVRLQRVLYYVLPDRNIQVQRFLAGDVQWTDSFAANQYGYLKARLGSQVVNSPYLGTYKLDFNFDLPPFRDNWPLREALVLAVDRAPLVHGMRPFYQPAYTLMPPLPGYVPPMPAWTRLSTSARHALARELYHRAGYSDAYPLRVDIDTSVQGADERHFYEAVAASWRVVLGAEVHVNEREFKVLIQERELHKLPLVHGAWIGDYPDPYTFLQLFLRGNDNNNGDYANRAYDALIDQAGREHDPARRYRLFEQAESRLDDDAAYVPLFYYATRHLVKPFVRGWQSNVMDRNLSRYMVVLEHQGV